MDRVDRINAECERVHGMSWSMACHWINAGTFDRTIPRAIVDRARAVLMGVDAIAEGVDRRDALATALSAPGRAA